MVQGRGGARFLLEAVQTIGVARKRSGQHFDRDVASETRVARAIDFAHAAAAEKARDLIRAESAAGAQAHSTSLLHGKRRAAAFP